MPVKINYTNRLGNSASSNLVLFTDEKFNIIRFKKNLSSTEYSYISDLLKTSDLKKNILIFELN